MPLPTRRVRSAWIIAAGLLAAGCAGGEAAAPAHPAAPGLPSAPWVSRAVPEARGEVPIGTDGRRQAVRYRGWSTEDFGRFRTYAYGDERPEPALGRAVMPAGPRDPAKGRRLFLDRNLGPCTGCHLVQGEDVWPAGSVGPDLSAYGDRNLADQHVFDMIYDPRHVFPQSVMPPWGTDGVLKADEIADVVTFLKTQRSPLPAERNPERNPATRTRPVGFGDNLDPTTNPAVVRAEDAADAWGKPGPAGKACADCHAGGPAAAMKGVATRFPRHVAPYGRVMSIEDFLAVHGPENTGMPLPVEGAANLDLTVLVKMASNGMPVALDLATPQNAAALERGKRSFYRRVGQRNHACADCHAGGPAAAMKGVAPRYPRYVAPYRRVMAIEDFLAVHGPETTGTALPVESAANLDLTVLVKMASNGMPLLLDLAVPENAAALERGKRSFYRRIGQRNHACADCHTTEGGKGADKFLGGRLLADVTAGLTRHFPTRRTSQADVWDMRKRIQWCMTPLGANMLAADSVEYAELELYLTSFDVGKPLSVPGIRH